MNISTFFGLNVGMSALDTMQQAEDVVSNNIANANTTGYVRETASIGEQAPFPSVPANDAPQLNGQLGQGSEVTSVTRQTNAFINEQDRANQGTLQMFQTHSQNLTQIESILNEPSSMSMQNAVDQFFSSWQTLSTDPSNTAARQAVISQGQTLGQTFQTITTQLEQMQTNLSTTVLGQIDQLNSDASQISTLNTQIANVENNNQNPNQLLDQRGSLLDDMAKLANISYTTQSNGMVNVSIVGPSGSSGSPTTVVNGATYTKLSLNTQTAGDGSSVLAPSTLLSSITSGSIAGNVQSLDDTQSMLSNLNSFLKTFADQVNAIQNPSGTGSNLFQITNNPASSSTPPTSNPTAGDIVLQIAPTLTTSNINAGSSPGDNSNALAMVALQNQTPSSYWSYSYTALATGNTVTTANSGTFDQSLAQTVSGLGIQASQVNSQEQTANSLASQSSNLRQSVSGVNINEEAANMVEYQNSYNAAAKFISVYDSMLQTLISMIP